MTPPPLGEGGAFFHIFLDIVYHTHPGDNCTKFGDPNSIIPDFHILSTQNALKKLQKGSKKAKKYFFEKSKKMLLPTQEGKLIAEFEPIR